MPVNDRCRTLRSHTVKTAAGEHDENILYLNENKKRTRNWFQVCGISVPLNGTSFGFIRSIPFIDKAVNAEDIGVMSFITKKVETPTGVTTQNVPDVAHGNSTNIILSTKTPDARWPRRPAVGACIRSKQQLTKRFWEPCPFAFK